VVLSPEGQAGPGQISERTEKTVSVDNATVGSRETGVLIHPIRNRGTAFSLQQPADLGPAGLVPPAMHTVQQQAVRAPGQFICQPTTLANNTFVEAVPLP
jgi:malate dehydrogenase (oxaloacetate-decarboxylating)